MNWNTYAELFPSRYIKKSQFDKVIEMFLEDKEGKCILEIGGGVKGSSVLERIKDKHKIYALDPNIISVPNWAKGRIDWDNTKLKFNLIIARNCINYFTEEQIKKIPTFLERHGYFFANSFLNCPKNMEREDTNNLGEIVKEKCEFKEPNILKHTLLRPKHPPIEHEFFYYSANKYIELFSRCEFTLYNKNSIIISLKKGDK